MVKILLMMWIVAVLSTTASLTTITLYKKKIESSSQPTYLPPPQSQSSNIDEYFDMMKDYEKNCATDYIKTLDKALKDKLKAGGNQVTYYFEVCLSEEIKKKIEEYFSARYVSVIWGELVNETKVILIVRRK